MKNDVFGMAIRDYQFSGEREGEILTWISLDEEDSLPVPYLFRDYDAMPELEQTALDMCRGSVLDIGCGAGSHSLHLAGKGFEVTSLDISAGAIEVCRARGLKNVVASDFWNFGGKKFDTLLFLMNGIGIPGRVDRLPEFFQKAKELLKPSGQILFDSSDIIYMFDRDADGWYEFPSPGNYYGEVIYQMEYKGLKSDPFPWLYIDYKTMANAAGSCGFECELVRKGDHYDYLGKLTLSGY